MSAARKQEEHPMRVESTITNSTTTQPNLTELEFEFATFRGRIAYLSSEACDQFTSLVMLDDEFSALDELDSVIDISLIENAERQLDFDSLTDVESFLLA